MINLSPVCARSHRVAQPSQAVYIRTWPTYWPRAHRDDINPVAEPTTQVLALESGRQLARWSVSAADWLASCLQVRGR